MSKGNSFRMNQNSRKKTTANLLKTGIRNTLSRIMKKVEAKEQYKCSFTKSHKIL